MKYNYAVFIGRFQPLHNGHLENINNALKIADKVLILVDSAYAARNIRNPFTFDERRKMILNSFGFNNFHGLELRDEEGVAIFNRLIIKPIRDFLYNDQDWMAEVEAGAACGQLAIISEN